MTDEELMEATVAIMERRNIIGVTSGPRRNAWQARAADRIIPGNQILMNLRPPPSVDFMRTQIENGDFRVFGEITFQYAGIEPNDPAFEPYVALAEEMDIPMGIHVGPGPPGAPYLFAPNYRARLHSPLLYEDLLVRHPNLRLYLMHAGWPMLDDLLALMWVHPQVYVGLGVISWALPPAEFHRYLRTIVEAGFGERVMFGSDQMVWPGALEFAIDNIESADYLTDGQKRDILYNNAARFLRLSDEEIAAHHGR
jgi:predicted TIM-barrel fold metal-dependent hydrolase